MEQIVRFSPKSAGGGTVASCPFPIGYGGFFQTDPNTIYSGTKWEQKKDVFILAAGTAYPSGSTGGKESHSHPLSNNGFAAIGNYYDTIAFASGTNRWKDFGNQMWAFSHSGDSPANSNTAHWNEGCFVHLGGLTDSASSMPPYFSMPFWIRTA